MTGRPAPPPKPTLKRYTWVRWHHELSYMPLWALVAQRAGVAQPIVEAFVQRLEVHASGGRPRGSIEDFNVAALAASWRIDDDALARVRAVLEEPDIGWIEQDFIVTFWERNPDEEDTTAKERQQRKRDRTKAMKELAHQARLGLISPQTRLERELVLMASRFPQQQMATWARLSTEDERHGVTHRDSVTVTARADQIDTAKQGGLCDVSAVPNHSGESGDVEIWLAMEGTRIVAERMRTLPARAKLEMGRWRKELADDAATLAQLIHDADTMGLTGGKFSDRIRAEIMRLRFENRGPSLPFPLKVKRGGTNG